jgi:hypothetical protein
LRNIGPVAGPTRGSRYSANAVIVLSSSPPFVEDQAINDKRVRRARTVFSREGDLQEPPSCPAATSARSVEESAAGADVLHIAGHTEGESATGDDALAIAGGGVSWRTIAAMHDMAPVVVLSARNAASLA